MNSLLSTLQAATPRLILASGSVARATLLRDAGLHVVVRPPAVDEAAVKREAVATGLPPAHAALRLAELKAAAIDDPDALVIGADQILVCDGRWFDKPSNLAAARANLQALRGRSHTLHTAAVCRQGGRVIWQHIAEPVLRMRPASDGFLDRYLALEGEAVLGCVGAYRLEAIGLQLFEDVHGEHAAILGLPMLSLLDLLRRRGVLLS